MSEKERDWLRKRIEGPMRHGAGGNGDLMRSRRNEYSDDLDEMDSHPVRDMKFGRSGGRVLKDFLFDVEDFVRGK